MTNQEPVAWMYVNEDGEVGDIGYGVSTVKDPYIKLLYEAPPKRDWVGLTNEEIDQAANNAGFGHINIALEIEAELKDKNNG